MHTNVNKKADFEEMKRSAVTYAAKTVDNDMLKQSEYFLDACRNHLYCVSALQLIESGSDKIDEVEVLDIITDKKRMEKAYKKAEMQTGVWFTDGGSIQTDHVMYYVMKHIHDYLYTNGYGEMIWGQTKCLRLCLAYENKKQLAG